MAGVLDLAQPALWHGGTALLVQLPPQEHVLGVVRRVHGAVPRTGVVRVPPVHKVDVIDELGANRAVAPGDDGDVAGASLQRGAGILHREGSHAHDHDLLAHPVHVLIGCIAAKAVNALSREDLAALPLDGARLAHPVIHGHDDPLAPYGAAARLQDNGVRLAATGGPTALGRDPRDTGIGEYPSFGQEPGGHAQDVGPDLRGGRVVPVGALPVVLENSVRPLGAVDLAGLIRKCGPNSAHVGLPLQQDHVNARVQELVSGQEANDPAPDHYDLVGIPGIREPTRLHDHVRGRQGRQDRRRTRVLRWVHGTVAALPVRQAPAHELDHDLRHFGPVGLEVERHVDKETNVGGNFRGILPGELAHQNQPVLDVTAELVAELAETPAGLTPGILNITTKVEYAHRWPWQKGGHDLWGKEGGGLPCSGHQHPQFHPRYVCLDS
mmetsp:Transcript_5670/g.20390  ORF Transcript_5670/g.20390 Transcript_5670/m.20390 type:complete len:439 (-) Transcript_5670:3432-4748(-)